MLTFGALLVGILLGGAGVVLYLKTVSNNALLSARKNAEKLVTDAQKEVETIKKEALIEAEEVIFNQKQSLELEYEKKLSRLKETEQKLDQKEMDIDRRGEIVGKKEKELLSLEDQLREKNKYITEKTEQLNQAMAEEFRKLEEISHLTREEAKQILIEEMKSEAQNEGARITQNIIEQARVEANRKAQGLVIQAIQQVASEQSVEATVSVVQLPNDDMKGRIIGREGRNIRAFELATGVDVIIDDTPEIVVLSSYNSFRREIAKRSLEKLITDGRIHPARIEEVLEKTAEELQESIKETGEQTLLELGIHGMAPELIEILGRLQFRTSYGQNVLNHSKEVAMLCGVLAAELGLDVRLAKRAGILHDIGKGVENYSEADHAKVGADLLRKYKENSIVINAAEAHHNEREATNPITFLVMASDKVSASRPGARRESLESFIKRMDQLEEIAKGFEGVENSYAIQAGREVRVIAETARVDDNQARDLAREIAKQIQMKVEFPGQIRVTVIREYRAYNYAT